MNRKIAIGGITLVVSFMALSTIVMIMSGHDWIMPDPIRVFISFLMAIFWFCVGWLYGSKNQGSESPAERRTVA